MVVPIQKNENKIIKEEFSLAISGLFLLGSIILLSHELISLTRDVRTLKIDEESSKKLSNIINNGKKYTVRVVPDPDEIMAGCIIESQDIIYFEGLKRVASEQEFYAALLHEAGHLEQKLSNVYALLSDNIVFNLVYYSSQSLLTSISPVVIFIICTRLLLYLKNKQIYQLYEYDADSYAVKYGYGKYLISFFKKIKMMYGLEKPCRNASCRFYRWFNSLLENYPLLKNRIESIIKNPDYIKKIHSLKISNVINYIVRSLDISDYSIVKKSIQFITTKFGYKLKM
jgi:Zn-dependent protease with chaperone function